MERTVRLMIAAVLLAVVAAILTYERANSHEQPCGGVGFVYEIGRDELSIQPLRELPGAIRYDRPTHHLRYQGPLPFGSELPGAIRY